MNKVTLVITSCGRIDLLKTTLQSFQQYNTYPIEDVIIIDDSADKEVQKEIECLYSENYNLIFNEENLGQVASIDKAYAEVKTEYIFHCEEDWQFYRSGFIEDSLKILQVEKLIKQVGLRSIENEMYVWHKDFAIDETPLRVGEVIFYKWIKRKKKNWFSKKRTDFSGLSFNPGLLRTSDYKRIGRYQNIGTCEEDISKYYSNEGYYIVNLAMDAVKHIGWEDSTFGHFKKQNKKI